jgi:hypothetical protein
MLCLARREPRDAMFTYLIVGVCGCSIDLLYLYGTYRIFILRFTVNI